MSDGGRKKWEEKWRNKWAKRKKGPARETGDKTAERQSETGHKSPARPEKKQL